MTGTSRSIVVGTVVAVVVGGALGLGLWFAGAPAEERARRLDQRRVEDLRRIANAVDLYWTRQGDVPPSLDALPGEGNDRVTLTDPVTGDRYSYRTLSSTGFEVCARFDTATTSDDSREFWRHAAGRQCFEADADDVERNPLGVRELRPLREAVPSGRIR